MEQHKRKDTRASIKMPVATKNKIKALSGLMGLTLFEVVDVLADQELKARGIHPNNATV